MHPDLTDTAHHSISADLVAVLVAVTDGVPRVLAARDAGALPSGPLERSHRSLQAGLRAWVETHTHHPLGYVEQLYTFADRDRYDESGGELHAISISYLALTREAAAPADAQAGWQDWYRYFPWEDHRDGPPAILAQDIVPALQSWATSASGAAERRAREQRAAMTFGLDGHAWSEDAILQRYELLYEAGLVAEARRHARGRGGEGDASAASRMADGRPSTWRAPASRRLVSGVPEALFPNDGLPTGDPMRHDHRRILATGIARLRAKIKYRPVVFELMPTDFTLLQLQQTVEALAGRCLHKQNFRRLIEQQELVEETGEVLAGGAGRPAKLFRFRRDVLLERAIAGTKLPLARAG